MENHSLEIILKKEEFNNEEFLLEDKSILPEKDIPEYINVNTFSEVKGEPPIVIERFQCSICKNKYKKQEYLTIHESLHNPLRYCPVCYQHFTCKKKFSIHLNQHIKEEMKEDRKNMFKCSYCKKQFRGQRSLINHERVHTNERPHKCEVCGKGFKQLGSLKSHYVIHTKIKQYTCELCHGGFTTSSSMKRHKKRIHERGKSFNCRLCTKIFYNMTDFRTHLNEVHPNNGYKRKCRLCSQIFHSRLSYRRHIQEHEEQNPKCKELLIRWCKCFLCGLELPHKNIIEHRRMHMGYDKAEINQANRTKIFKCKQCTEEFPTKTFLINHMDSHMEQNTKCELCANVFTYLGHKQHMKKSHQMLRCHVCCVAIIGKEKLYSHYKKNHANVCRKFVCGICGKQYMSKNVLKLHIKIIHKHKNNTVKKYKCSECGRKFFCRYTKACHMRQAHNTTKFECRNCDFVSNSPIESSRHSLTHKNNEDKSFGGRVYKQFQSKIKQCKTCYKFFNSYKQYIEHNQLKNCIPLTENMEMECNVCFKIFFNKELLKKHMKSHLDPQYFCRLCKIPFSRLDTLKRHMRCKHPNEKVYKCEDCAEKFDSFLALRNHRDIHELELIDTYGDSSIIKKEELIKQDFNDEL